MSRNPISPLPSFTRYITTHNDAGQAIVHSATPGNWTSYANGSLGFNVAYTTSEFPANMNNEHDIAEYEKTITEGNLGLVKRGGSVCRVVDFAPNQPGLMHRTQSLDYGIVLEGEVDMILDSGEKRRLQRGDIAVQRGTMHEWQNPSTTEWTRMLFVLLDAQPIVVGGKQLGEDLGDSAELKPSN
ncbi:cupin domain protein [Aspergillus terreus]|uniref:Cupin domain protein n=1 Tax=Aspergillus terreus TaxID=33178 RepID=A0A5M3YL57_ASPTE|nr:hypothetical protein ATETN484_0001023100 [Aspergillus terreus]GFF12087.1 cupin domain protein [Aspergillus terreus]